MIPPVIIPRFAPRDQVKMIMDARFKKAPAEASPAQEPQAKGGLIGRLLAEREAAQGKTQGKTQAAITQTAAPAAVDTSFDPKAVPAWDGPMFNQAPRINAQSLQMLTGQGRGVLDLVVNANRQYPNGVPPQVMQNINGAIQEWKSSLLGVLENEGGNGDGTLVRQADNSYKVDHNVDMATGWQKSLKDANDAEAFQFLKLFLVASPSFSHAIKAPTAQTYFPPKDLIDHVLGPNWRPQPAPAPAPVVTPPAPPAPVPVETLQLDGRDMAAILSGGRGQEIYFKKAGHAAIRGGEKDEFGYKKKKRGGDAEDVAAKIDLSRYAGRTLDRLDVQLGKFKSDENVTVKVLVDGQQAASFAKNGRGDDKVTIDAAMLGGPVDAARITVLIVPESEGRHHSNFSVTGIDVALAGAK